MKQQPKPMLFSTPMIKHLTVSQLIKACSANKYILVRYSAGYVVGVNSTYAVKEQVRLNIDTKRVTNIVGFMPCNFNQYLSHKLPFLNS